MACAETGKIEERHRLADSQADSKQGANRLRPIYGAMNPVGRIGRPGEIASAALFLASSESSDSNGIDLLADGGIAQF